MIKKHILLTFLLVIITIISCDLLINCDDKEGTLSFSNCIYKSIELDDLDEQVDQDDLIGEWHLEAYVDIYDCSLDTFPSEAPYPTVSLIFNQNGTLAGSAPSNKIYGEYKVEGNVINILAGGTEIMEPEWGKKFWDIINNSNHWCITDSILIVYSDEIMIFNKFEIDEKELIKKLLIGEWKELYQSPPTKLIISDSDTIYQLVEQLPFVPGEFDTFRMYYDITAIDSMLTVRNYYDSWFPHDLPVTRKHKFWFLGTDSLNIDQFGFGDLEDRLTTFYLIRENYND